MTETPHLDPLVLDRYIAGELVGSAALAVETHASACPACGEALQREALLATAMREAAEAISARRPASRPRRRLAYAVGALAAMAAAAALLVIARPRVSPRPSPTASVALIESEVAAKASMSAGEAFDGPMAAATDTFDDRMNAPSSTL
jgi:hypothetical protein